MAERTPSFCRRTPTEIGCGHTPRLEGQPAPATQLADAMFPDLTAFLAMFSNPDAILRDHIPDHADAPRPPCVACSIGRRGVEWPCALHIGAAGAPRRRLPVGVGRVSDAEKLCRRG